MQNLKINNSFSIAFKRLMLYLGCITIFLSCNNKFDSEQDMLAYLNDESNGYTQQKSINGVNFTFTYRPTDLLVKQELRDPVNDLEVNNLRKKYREYMYFNLSMSKNNKELLSAAPTDKNEFASMVNELTFNMDKKVSLYTKDHDTFDLVDFIYPRLFGMSRATTIMFIYPRKDDLIDEDSFLNFSIQDLGLYTGEVNFKINTEKINNEPQLYFNK